MSASKLYVHSIETFATLDGSGIRMAIFFQGCPLKCVCCHNVDTLDIKGYNFEYTPMELLIRALRNKMYFSKGGGVTLSGGDPLVQASVIKDFAGMLKKEGIDVLLDTSGCVVNKNVEELLLNVDSIILDLKYPTDEEYINYTGLSINKFHEFMSLCQSLHKKVKIRTVIIPKINDTKKYIEDYVNILKKYNNVIEYELLGFHTMGFKKYENLGIENKLLGTKDLPQDKLDELQEFLDKIYPL